MLTLSSSFMESHAKIIDFGPSHAIIKKDPQQIGDFTGD
jgi:hypothetical protein